MSATVIDKVTARIRLAALWAESDLVYETMSGLVEQIGAPEDGESIVGESRPAGDWLVLSVKRVRG